jgi:5-methylcytosine-specific restriction protein B
VTVQKGFYPAYLYYKQRKPLILAYCISKTEEHSSSWPAEITNSAEKIAAHFDEKKCNYGDSFVFKSYQIKTDGTTEVSEADIEADLSEILDDYKSIVATTPPNGSGTENPPDADEELIELLTKKKQVILYGPPGTGKTYNTKKIALELLGRE